MFVTQTKQNGGKKSTKLYSKQEKLHNNIILLEKDHHIAPDHFHFLRWKKPTMIILKVTQTKHHWWWKANQVFDVLEATKKLNSNFVFLEEDHLLAPDVLHLLKLMEQQKKELEEKVTFCPQSF